MPPSETLGYIISQINDITVKLNNAAPNVIHYWYFHQYCLQQTNRLRENRSCRLSEEHKKFSTTGWPWHTKETCLISGNHPTNLDFMPAFLWVCVIAKFHCLDDNPISSLPLPVQVWKAEHKPSDNYYEDFGICRQQITEDIACKLGRHPKHISG